MGAKFSATTLKVKLNVAVKRMEGRSNKEANQVKLERKTIAKLLRDGKDETARIRVEAVFSMIDHMHLYELLTLMCNLLGTRVALLAQAKACPDDLVETCASLIYAAPKADVAELEEVAKQLAARFGEDWAKAHINNASRKVNQRVIQRLSVTPPTFAQTMDYLDDCARAAGISWKKSAALEREAENAQAIGSVLPAGGGPDAGADGLVEYGDGPLPTGTLTVRIHEAQRLYVAQMFAKQDPYCHVKVLGLKKVSYKTTVDRNAGDTAFFHEEYFPFTVKERGLRLQVDVYNHNMMVDDFLGRAWVEVDSLVVDGRARWLPLRRGSSGKTDAGEVKVSATFQVLDGDADDVRRLEQKRAEAMEPAGAPLQPVGAADPAAYPGPPPPGYQQAVYGMPPAPAAAGYPPAQGMQQQQPMAMPPPQQPVMHHHQPAPPMQQPPMQQPPMQQQPVMPAPPMQQPQPPMQQQQQQQQPVAPAPAEDLFGLPSVPRGQPQQRSPEPGEGGSADAAGGKDDYDDLEARFRALQSAGRH